MGEWTPGPWTFGPSATILGANGRRVCRFGVFIDETELADARLIAAAPDLLDALETLVRAVNTNELASAMACHDVAAFSNVADALKVALPAIARAKGSGE